MIIFAFLCSLPYFDMFFDIEDKYGIDVFGIYFFSLISFFLLKWFYSLRIDFLSNKISKNDYKVISTCFVNNNISNNRIEAAQFILERQLKGYKNEKNVTYTSIIIALITSSASIIRMMFNYLIIENNFITIDDNMLEMVAFFMLVSFMVIIPTIYSFFYSVNQLKKINYVSYLKVNILLRIYLIENSKV